MDDRKAIITTRSLPALTRPPAPNPETRPKPLLSHTLTLRPPGIPPEKLPKAIDRSGEKKTTVTTHDHLAPRGARPAQKLGPATALAEAKGKIVISGGGIASVEGVYVGQATKPAGKARAKR
ncbi:MAG: hypothetical protein A2Y70_03015 [Candidatus Aminicenantes bacterium RBG_13_64_14]|nr:MAG: hypothetical protein A2Y70_03015 [Candidatus Aminicenantes bacterium RBG_13_64_14]